MAKTTRRLRTPIYYRVWTGDYDRILGYDYGSNEIIVQDTKTGVERKHMTTLDTKYLTDNPELNPVDIPFVKQLQFARNMVKQCFPKRMLDTHGRYL